MLLYRADHDDLDEETWLKTLTTCLSVGQRDMGGAKGLERHRINGVGHLSKWPNTNLEAVAKFWLKFVFGKKLLMIAQIVDCQIVWKKKDCLARFCLVAANCKLLLDPCLAVEWRKRKTMFWEDKWWRCRVDRSEVGVGTMWVGSMAFNRGATMGRTALNRD